MIKKLLLYICALLMAVGCTDENAVVQPDTAVQDGKVTLGFSVNVPDIPQAVATRTFATPAVTSLHLIVFDENGYLVEKVEAKPVSSLDYSTTKQIGFTATLTASAAKRTIHFIANYANAMALAFGSESDVIGGIKHTGGQDAYWQCKELTAGVSDDTEIGCVPLIHNFAKITVVNGDTEHFELTGFTVVNVVTEGYISPYNMNTGRFAKFIKQDANGEFEGQETASFECREYTAITQGEEGYEGYVPGTAELNLNTAITEWVDFTDGNTANDAFYMYERSFETDNHTFVIVKGRYSGSTTDTYYKVDLIYKGADNATQYYNILRNFNYQITLTSVTGAGKATPEEAYNMMGAHNNLTNSVETQQLTNISDGNAQLYVSYTSEYIVSERDVTLYYKYIPDAKNAPATETNNEISVNGTGSPVAVTWAAGDVIRSLSVSSSDEGDASENEGWRCITLTPQTPDAYEAKVQSITITAGNLSRTVTYILRPAYEMAVKCTNPVEEGIGKSVTVTTTIPTKLPEALFPLDFYIVAEKRSLYPNASMNQLPVEIIPNSLITNDDFYTFGFVYNMSYDEYLSLGGNSADATMPFRTYFLTNTEKSASAVHVYNKYFNMAEASFVNGSLGIKNASLISTGTYGSETATLTFTAQTADNYTITLGDGTTETVALSADETYTRSFVNATWNSIAEAVVSITVDEQLYEFEVLGGERNKLNLQASSTSASDGSLIASTMLSVFNSEADAKAMSNALGTVANGMLTSEGTTMQIENLEETDLVWFAYTTGDYLYYASATAKALYDETAELIFARINVPTTIGITGLEGEQYYGKNKTVTVNFETNKVGQYLIYVKEGNNAEQLYDTSTVTNATGEQTASFATKYFSGDISVRIVYDANGNGEEDDGEAESDSYDDGSRNVLYIKPGSISGKNSNNNTTVKMTNESIESSNKGWNDASSLIDGLTYGDIRSGMSYTNNSLSEGDVFYFTYRSGGGGNRKYYSVSLTAGEIAEGGEMVFIQQ